MKKNHKISDIYGKTFKCRVCQKTYNYSYDPLINKYEVCWSCGNTLIPEHIPEDQHEQYVRIYLIKQELKKHD